MLKQKLIFLIFFITVQSTQLNPAPFEKNWAIMQSNYKQLCNAMTRDQKKTMNTMLCHSYWNNQIESINKLICKAPDKKFLHNRVIAHNMVRKGITNAQRYEIDYLQNGTTLEVKNKLKNFKEENFSNFLRECTEFNCSTNTLGHLYYTAKILENLKNQHSPIITEFGGGYGNLARIFKFLIPNSTIIIIDLPEFTALQNLFLTSALPSTEVIIHYKLPTQYKSGAIHLVPIFLIENMTLKSDVFVSNFGLSEAPKYTQQIVADKKFFNAQVCYISGQTEGWNMFENHDTIYQGIKNSYATVYEKPFHIYSTQRKSYEIIGTHN